MRVDEGKCRVASMDMVDFSCIALLVTVHMNIEIGAKIQCSFFHLEDLLFRKASLVNDEHPNL